MRGPWDFRVPHTEGTLANQLKLNEVQAGGLGTFPRGTLVVCLEMKQMPASILIWSAQESLWWGGWR